MPNDDAGATGTRWDRSAAVRRERPAIASLANRLRHGTVLVAASTEADAPGAIALADGVRQRYGSRVHVLSSGSRPHEILRHARTHPVALIALGLLHRGLVKRALGPKTTAIVAHVARVPVLAVVPTLCGLPRRAVAVIDFRAPSKRAARAALDLIARPVSRTGALLRLVYVDRRTVGTERSTEMGDALATQDGVQVAFEKFIRELDVPPHVSVDSSVVRGSVTRELLRFAAESEADLIVVGVPRRTRLKRCGFATTAAALLRDSRCSVLVVPAPD